MKPIALLAELEVEFIIFNRVQIRQIYDHIYACAVAKSTTHKSFHRAQWTAAQLEILYSS